MKRPDDPERLADAAPRSPLGELLASAERDLPSDEQIARLAAQLGPTLDGTPSPPRPPASAPGASGLVKVAVVASAMAALVGAGLALRQASHNSADAPTSTPKATLPSASAVPTQPPAAVPPPPALDSAAISDTASSAPSVDKTDASSAKAPSAPSKAPSEAALLEQARRALNSSPSYALSLANQHRARFPNGILTQEREVIAIEALRKLNRGGEADQRATGFSKAFPGSAHQRMVDEASPK